ncbi:MAG: DUF3445 domain-containing protein [Pseudomonadota bacterium]
MTRDQPFFKSARRHAMGIKALDPATWIMFAEDAEDQLAERRRLLDACPGEVLAALPGSEEAVDELLTLLLDHLQHHAADRYRIEAATVIERATGRPHPRRSEPLSLIGRLVQEDFCLLQKRDDRYILTSAVLCFPAHWLLSEKIGRPLLDIHEPVPGFAEQLGSPVERLFERFDPEKPVQRQNWSLVDTNALFLPPSHRDEPTDIPTDQIGERLHLRVERQTFRRLPQSGAVVFGIRTILNSLAQAIDSADAADALSQRLHELPDPMQRYKNLTDLKPALLAFLEQRRSAMLVV